MQELKAYLKQLREHTKVVSIDYVLREMDKPEPHETPTTPPTRVYTSTIEYLQERELQRIQKDSRSLKVH